MAWQNQTCVRPKHLQCVSKKKHKTLMIIAIAQFVGSRTWCPTDGQYTSGFVTMYSGPVALSSDAVVGNKGVQHTTRLITD